MSARRRSWLVFLLVGGLVAGCGGALEAQSTGGAVFVAIPDVFPDIEARALLVRERGRDVILLRVDDATVDVLSMSLMVLHRAQAQTPRPRHGQMIPITGFVLTRPPGGDALRRVERILRRLSAAPIRPVGNLGDGRWVRLRDLQ